MGQKKTRSRLLRQHRDLIEASAITLPIEKARGYRSVRSPEGLRRLGFSETQSQLIPGLLIPIWDIHGENTRYQLRPDKPRLDHESGKEHKYENLPGIGVALDVNPRVRKLVKDASQPLFITEGVRKGDAGASQGLATVALYSVWNWRGTDESGAVMVLSEWDEIPLRSRTVYVVFDSDVMTKRSVKLALERLGRVLRGRGATVKFIYLPGGEDGEKVGLDDWFAAGYDVNELLSHSSDRIRGLPEVIVNARQLREVTRDAVTSLESANDPPQIFRRTEGLVRARIDERGRPFIEPYTVSGIRNRLTAVADFYRVTKQGDPIHVPPPQDVATDILALPEWSFPPLESVVESPTVRPDGSVLDKPGYDPATRLVYIPEPDFLMPRVPEDPPSRWLKGARRVLLEVLHDFPFVDEASRANALALTLTPIFRPAISGPVPMAVVTAPQAGTGKGLIVECVSLIATGRPAELMSQCRTEEEWRKQITSTLLEGPSLVCLDNLTGRLTSGALAQALTSTVWRARVLGVSKDAAVPQRATWLATGNNVLLGGDLPRRVYQIKLDAEVSRPWLRDSSDFQHYPLTPWVRENRPKLLAAALGLARSWYARGCPEADVSSLGSYEDWCRVVGGVLANAGIEGFLGNLGEMYETLDPTEDQWEAFLRAWHKVFRSRSIRASDVYRKVVEGGTLAAALPDELAAELEREGSFTRKLGWSLRDRDRRRYGDPPIYLEGVKNRVGSTSWRVSVG